jgi:hypothetical protein
MVGFAGCSSPRLGEFGEAACKNGVDDDDDMRVDCDDPDCLGTDYCRVRSKIAPLPSPNSMDSGRDLDAGPNRDASQAALDATIPLDSAPPILPPPVQISDAGVLPTDAGPAFVDAAGLPPACDPACKADEVCTDGKCTAVAVDTSGRYLLTIQSVLAPDQSPTSRCFDTLCENPLSAVPYGLCVCHVDPYVVVVRIRKGVETKLGMTSVVQDNPAPMYTDATFTIELMAGDVLRFDVWDSNDPPIADQFMFACKPNLTNLMPGMIGCSTLAGPLYAQIVQVNARLDAAP